MSLRQLPNLLVVYAIVRVDPSSPLTLLFSVSVSVCLSVRLAWVGSGRVCPRSPFKGLLAGSSINQSINQSINRDNRKQCCIAKRVRWKVASDLRFRAAISEPKIHFFCGISGDLAPSTRKSLAIAIVRLLLR